MNNFMKYNSIITPVLTITSLVFLLGLSGESLAVSQSGSCPVDHHHMGHGMGYTADIDLGSKGITPGKKLADAECSSCHGTNGISVSDDIPNLAGQQSMYMCAWLDGCRKQGEKCEGHEDIAAKLRDQDIVDLSEFYAHLPFDKR